MEQANFNEYNIAYCYKDYLSLNEIDKYNIATLIYCDYGALSFINRKVLLENVYKSLKNHGVFILDVFTPEKYKEFKELQTWEIYKDGGFWSDESYFLFHNNYKYNENTTLEQRVVFTKNDGNVYYIWHHYFSKNNLVEEVESAGFKVINIFSDIKGKAYDPNSQTMSIVLQKAP